MALILVVDDRPINREFLAELLGYVGHRTIEAADGKAALTLALAEQPDLVISDILMPTMNGYELVQQIRQHPAIAGVPVIFYTATYSAPEARQLANACGVTIVLPKPSEPLEILEAVNEALGISAPLDLAPSMPTAALADAGRLPIGSKIETYLHELNGVRLTLNGIVERGVAPPAEQQRLQQVTAAYAENVAHMHRICNRLFALIDTGLEMGAKREIASILQTLLDTAAKVIAADYVGLGVLNPQVPGQQYALGKGIDVSWFAQPGAIGTGLLDAVLSTRTNVRIHSPGEIDAAELPPDHPPVGSFLAVPLTSKERVYGWLYFAHRPGSSRFSEEDENIAATLASSGAMFYENHMLYDVVQRHAAQLQLEITRRQRAEQAVRERDARLQELQAELFHATRVHTMGQLASAIVHELNQPLAAISSYLQAARRIAATADGARVAELVANAADQSLRAGSIVKRMRKLMGRGEIDRRAENLNDAVEEASALAFLGGNDKHVHRRLELAADLPPALIDRIQIQQVVLNLVRNAIEAMEGSERRELTIQTRRAPTGEIIVAIRDTGPGLAQSVASQLFQPFVSTKPSGMGLGLSICRSIINAHSGALRAESNPGGGTVFLFDVPAAESDADGAAG
jgi:signal transduction histidine kinase/CheY-like chemotaxis protein